MFETTVCWSCSNFWVDSVTFGPSFIGFDAVSESSVGLLEFLDTVLPYDRGYEKGKNEEILRLKSM